MLPPVAEAIELLDWVGPEGTRFAEQVSASTRFIEGAVHRINVNACERNAAARASCIAHYGPTCHVCDFDFARVYGVLAAGFIHVHHFKPLAEIGETYSVNPITDLRPVCANCHAVIHLGGSTRSIDDVRRLIAVAGIRTA